MTYEAAKKLVDRLVKESFISLTWQQQERLRAKIMGALWDEIGPWEDQQED